MGVARGGQGALAQVVGAVGEGEGEEEEEGGAVEEEEEEVAPGAAAAAAAAAAPPPAALATWALTPAALPAPR